MFGKYVVWAAYYPIILPPHTKHGSLMRRNEMGIRVIRYPSEATRYVTLCYKRSISVFGEICPFTDNPMRRPYGANWLLMDIFS